METSLEKTVINLIADGRLLKDIQSQTGLDIEIIRKIADENREEIRIRKFFHLMKEGCDFVYICKKMNISPEEGKKIYKENKEFFAKSLKEQLEIEEEIATLMDDVAIAYLKYHDLLTVYRRVQAVLQNEDTMVNKPQAFSRFVDLSNATFEALNDYSALLKEARAKARGNGEFASGLVQKYLSKLREACSATKDTHPQTPQQLGFS
jgi:hypothetical protein